MWLNRLASFNSVHLGSRSRSFSLPPLSNITSQHDSPSDLCLMEIFMGLTAESVVTLQVFSPTWNRKIRVLAWLHGSQPHKKQISSHRCQDSERHYRMAQKPSNALILSRRRLLTSRWSWRSRWWAGMPALLCSYNGRFSRFVYLAIKRWWTQIHSQGRSHSFWCLPARHVAFYCVKRLDNDSDVLYVDFNRRRNRLS